MFRMGEGEVSVVVVSNVGEMEIEKNKQKRDRQWVTGDFDWDPVAKKQGKEGLGEVEVDPCAMNQSEALESIEEKLLSTDGFDAITLEPCAEKIKKEFSDGMELESCGRRQTAEALSGNMTTTSDTEHTQPCSNVTVQQTCEVTQAPESLNYIGVKHLAEQPVKEDSSAMELDPAGEKHLSGVSNDMEMEPVVEQLSRGV